MSAKQHQRPARKPAREKGLTLAVGAQALLHLCNAKVDDATNFLPRQLVEDDDPVDSVDELGREVTSNGSVDELGRLLGDGRSVVGEVVEVGGSEVRGPEGVQLVSFACEAGRKQDLHANKGIFEADDAALAVGQASCYPASASCERSKARRDSPSSRTWRNRVTNSFDAFSISSIKTTEKGLRLTY